MRIVKFFNHEGYLMGVVFADAFLVGEKNNYSYCMEITKTNNRLPAKDFMNVCIYELIQEIKQWAFSPDTKLIHELEELLI